MAAIWSREKEVGRFEFHSHPGYVFYKCLITVMKLVFMLIANVCILYLRLKNACLGEEGIIIFMNSNKYTVYIYNFIFECL